MLASGTVRYFTLLAVSCCLALPAFPQMRRTRGVRPTNVNPNLSVPAADFDGKLIKVDGKKILLTVDKDRLLEIRRNGKTKFFDGVTPIKPADFRPGDLVSVEATHDVDSSLVAVSVYLGHAPGVQKAKDTSASEANSLEVPKDEDERLDQQKKEIRSGESRGTVLGGSKIGQDWQAPADEEKRLDRGNPDLTPAERKLLRRAPPAPAQADQDQKQDETKAPQKNKADDQHGSAASGNRDASGSKE